MNECSRSITARNSSSTSCILVLDQRGAAQSSNSTCHERNSRCGDGLAHRDLSLFAGFRSDQVTIFTKTITSCRHERDGFRVSVLWTPRCRELPGIMCHVGSCLRHAIRWAQHLELAALHRCPSLMATTKISEGPQWQH